MPCILCSERSEDYPRPAIFRTPFMATVIPGFQASTDFLCPRCFSVYFSFIEYKCRRPPTAPIVPFHEQWAAGCVEDMARTCAWWRHYQIALSLTDEDNEAEDEMNASKRMRVAF